VKLGGGERRAGNENLNTPSQIAAPVMEIGCRPMDPAVGEAGTIVAVPAQPPVVNNSAFAGTAWMEVCVQAVDDYSCSR